MNNALSLLKLHQKKALLIIALVNIQIMLNLAMGDIKLMTTIDWLDIFGEGGSTLLSLSWIVLILCSRPGGRVTNLLISGLTCILIASWQDFLDEIIYLPDSVLWPSWVESIPMPIGLILLSFGLYHWHKEQLAINGQLNKRERLFRDYRTVDGVTQLADARYLREQLDRELQENQQQQSPLSLLMIDIDHFSATNQKYGFHEGDRLLHEVSEILVLNLRRCDLLCRYAGDRYAVLLPNTGEHLAQLIAQQLSLACRHFAFKTAEGETVYHTVSIGRVTTPTAKEDSSSSVIQQANHQLLLAKEQVTPAVRVA